MNQLDEGVAVDYFAAIAADAERRRADRDARLSAPCPMPRCRAGVGRDCTTPNGWLTYHKARERAVRGEATPAHRRPRLTDAQAQRIEWAAESGTYHAAGQYATLGGDATERACADALERHGYIEQYDPSDSGERKFRLTAEGWRTYWHHRLVIRRLPDGRHDSTCPCASLGGQP
jgi:hypothetical protein